MLKIHLFEVELVVLYLLEYGYQPLLHLLGTTLDQPRQSFLNKLHPTLSTSCTLFLDR